MEIHHSMRDGCMVVRLTGSINLFTAPQVQRALLKDLAERPYGVVCDLSGVESIDPGCARVFSTVASHPFTVWPETTLLLCAARPVVAEVLLRQGVPSFLPLHDTVEDALDNVLARPPTCGTSSTWPRPPRPRPPPGCTCATSSSTGSWP